MEALFGAPVTDGTAGKGSELTALTAGADGQLVHARIGPLLEAMEADIEAEIQNAVSATNTALRICASLESLIAFSRGSCDIAGFHIPIGALERPVWSRFEHYLSSSHAIINLATRRQGIMVAKGNPKNIWSIHDLMREDVQFVNRQQGAGTRMILDLLLAQEGTDGRAIHGYENIEMTHAAVGAYILCGKADAGLGVEAAARQFDLDFVPLLSERYFLACEKSLLQQARFAPVMSALTAKDFQMEVNRLAGYNGIHLGKVEEAAGIAPPVA